MRKYQESRNFIFPSFAGAFILICTRKHSVLSELLHLSRGTSSLPLLSPPLKVLEAGKTGQILFSSARVGRNEG